MKVNVQKRIVADIIKGSKKRVRLDPERLDEVKEAITKKDLKGLIDDGAIKIKQKNGISRARAKEKQHQKKKGLQRGTGSRKGTKNARLEQKRTWINKIRLQRDFIKELKDKGVLTPKIYREYYSKAKGGFFRSKRHIKLYMKEQGLIEK